MTWLQGLGPGDKVVEFCAGWGAVDIMRTVERVTKTQIILRSGSRWSRKTGRKIGSGGFCGPIPEIKEATPARTAAIARRRKCERLSAVEWSKLNDAQLDVVLGVVE